MPIAGVASWGLPVRSAGSDEDLSLSVLLENQPWISRALPLRFLPACSVLDWLGQALVLFLHDNNGLG